jgi:N-acetylglucosaminyldiphosphoundecaprenol N-acetyl-beta-D-mannosaminyltransferase
MKNTREVEETPYKPRSINIMGVPVAPFESYDQALKSVEEAVESKRKTFWGAINPIKMYNAWHKPELLNLLRQLDVSFCDGVGVSIASKILYGKRLERITGCDLFFKLISLASQKQWRVYLLGASAESNTNARLRLQEKYPGLEIVGQDGYFKDSLKVVEHINARKADLLFVAMGSPKQEQWISQHRQVINATFCMGVGGSFDVAAGHVRRAPKIFRMTGTEFLFRIAMEPRKRFAHNWILLSFLFRVVCQRLTGASV